MACLQKVAPRRPDITKLATSLPSEASASAPSSPCRDSSPLSFPSRASSPRAPHQLSSDSLRAFEILSASHRGEYAGPSWVKINISEEEYATLCSVVDAAELPFRHDYDADSQLLVLRMPESPIHNTFKTHLAILLAQLLQQAISSSIAQAESEAAASDLRDLHDLITYHVELETTSSATRDLHGRKVPDISFCYSKDTHAPFVAEIGYSQKSQDLASLARSYILKSGGAIRTVLTVNLEYQERTRRKRKEGDGDGDGDSQQTRAASSICLYRLGERVMWDAVFRDEEGMEQEGELNLCLSDFIPEGSERHIGRQVLEGIPITISFRQLAELLRKGERRQVAHDKTPEPEGSRRAQGRARKRKQVTFSWDLPEGPTHDTDSPDTSPDSQQSSKKRRLARATGARDVASLVQRPAGSAEITRITRSRSRSSPGERSEGMTTRSRSRSARSGHDNASTTNS